MKPKRNGPRSTITTIYVRPADYKRLVRLAAEQDRSVASVVTLALDAEQMAQARVLLAKMAKTQA